MLCLKDDCEHYRHHDDDWLPYCTCYATGDSYEFLHNEEDCDEKVECLHPDMVLRR